jgi:aspartate ammonia-lyase
MLPGEQTERSRQCHSFSGKTLGQYPLLVGALLQIKSAAARANRHFEVIAQHDSDRVQKACEFLLTTYQPELFVVDVFQGGGGIGMNVNVNDVLQRISGVDTTIINASQSTADVCATAIRMAILQLAQNACFQLDLVKQTMESKAGQFSQVRTIARTCLRDASVTTLGSTFQAYADAIQRRRLQLTASADLLHEVNLGGTVFGSEEGAPAGFGVHAIQELNDTFPYSLSQRTNLYDAAQNSDDLGLVGHQLALLVEVLIKLCHDLRLLSSGPDCGFAEINLPTIIRGSTFYANKSNPTVPETMLQCCFDILGKQRTMQACLEHAELQLNVFEPQMGVSLYDSLRRLAACLTLFDQHCLKGITVNLDRCATWAAAGSRPLRTPTPPGETPRD